MTVVLASRGYPETSSSGDRDHAGSTRSRTWRSSTPPRRRDGDGFVTAGGRVLDVTALGATAGEARDRAYAAVERIDFDGRQVRGDIAARAVGRQQSRVAP